MCWGTCLLLFVMCIGGGGIPEKGTSKQRRAQMEEDHRAGTMSHQQHQSWLYLCLSKVMETRDHSKEHLIDLSLILLLNAKITPSAIICISLSIYLDSVQVKSFKVNYKTSELLNFFKLFFT